MTRGSTFYVTLCKYITVEVGALDHDGASDIALERDANNAYADVWADNPASLIEVEEAGVPS